eukprot:9442990-Prorocentrum_lima.AAC.1
MCIRDSHNDGDDDDDDDDDVDADDADDDDDDKEVDNGKPQCSAGEGDEHGVAGPASQELSLIHI